MVRWARMGFGTPRGSIRSLAILLPLAVASAGCPEGTDLVQPSVEGTVQGRVLLDGVGASGVTVQLSSGQSATTGADGAYSIAGVSAGVHTATIAGFPADAVFPATSKALAITSDGQSVVVDFSGTRPSAATTTHTGTLIILGGDLNHDPFAYSAGNGKQVSVRSVVNGAQISISGISGFAPSSLPILSGTIFPDGNVVVFGTGRIGSTDDVSISGGGLLINGRLDLEITVGTNGELPGGMPIRYHFSG